MLRNGFTSTGNVLRVLTIVTVLAAASPAAGTAGRWGPGTSGTNDRATARVPFGTCHQYCTALYGTHTHSGRPVVTVVTTRPVTATANPGFNWDDAAIGFGVAWGLVVLALGSLLLIRRASTRQAGQLA